MTKKWYNYIVSVDEANQSRACVRCNRHDKRRAERG